MRLPDRLIQPDPDDHANCVVNRAPRITTSAWTAFLEELEALITDLVRHRAAWMLLGVSGGADLFVQLAVLSDGTVEAEAVSTTAIACPTRGCQQPRHLHAADQRDQLRRLGWKQPSPGRDNYHRSSDPNWHSPAPMFSELLTRTLAEPFATPSPSRLLLTTGSIRGTGLPARAA